MATAPRCGGPAAKGHRQAARRARLAPAWSTPRAPPRRRSRSSPETCCCRAPPSRPPHHSSGRGCSSRAASLALGTRSPLARSHVVPAVLALMISPRGHSALDGCLGHACFPEGSQGSRAHGPVPARHSRCGAATALRARGSPASTSMRLALASSQRVQGRQRGLGPGPCARGRAGWPPWPSGVSRAVVDSLQPSVRQRGPQPGASPWTTWWTTRGAIAQVRSPLSMVRRRLVTGSIAAHPQGGARDQRGLAAAALTAPACTARRRAQSASRGPWVPRPSWRTAPEQAAACAAPSPTPCRTVVGSTSNPRVTARMPQPTAHPSVAGATRWPCTGVPWVSWQEPPPRVHCHWRQGPPWGGPWAQSLPSPTRP
jgi:hypothetical protein